MSDEQRQLPTFSLRRTYGSQPILNPEIAAARAQGEGPGATTTTAGSSPVGEREELPYTSLSAHGEVELAPPLFSHPPPLPHRRNSPTPLYSPHIHSTLEIRAGAGNADMRLRRPPPLRPAPAYAGPSTQSPRTTTEFVSIEGSNMSSPGAEVEGPTISAAANDSNDGVNPEATSSEVPTAKARKKAKNRIASAKSRRKKRESIEQLQKQKDEMEAEIARREESVRKLREKYEATKDRAAFDKVYLHELQQHFLQQGDRGKEEWEKVQARLNELYQYSPIHIRDD